MRSELKRMIIEFNKRRAVEGEKATDLDIIVGELLKLPPGQLKKVLTDEVVEILKKYGYEEVSE